jgi:hypothetical protein
MGAFHSDTTAVRLIQPFPRATGTTADGWTRFAAAWSVTPHIL